MPQLDCSRLDLAAQHLATLQTLLNRHTPDSEVWAFGSRVNGDAHEGSDLDLVLRHSHNIQQSAEGYSELKEALQKSSLPMLVEIHDWAHLPADFHRNIERCYVVLQAGCASGSSDTPGAGRGGV